MKILWCWRCRIEVPMLEGAEGEKAYELYGSAFRNGSGNTMQEKFKALIDYYKEITGEEYTNPNAIIHHIAEIYGPPCEKCGKPYRTSKASFCAGCGHKRNMKEFEEFVNKLIKELISILITIKEKANDKSDLICTSFYSAEELRNEIDKFIIQLQPGNKEVLEDIALHFSPGNTFDGHAMANGWSGEFSILTEQFNKVHGLLKNTVTINGSIVIIPPHPTSRPR